MAFPHAANITYRVSKNTKFSVGRDGASFNQQAKDGLMSVLGQVPTLVVGEEQAAPDIIWYEPWDVSPPERLGASSGTAGWFDNTGFRLNTSLHSEGLGCYEYQWPTGQRGSPDGGAIRHNLTMSKEVDISFRFRMNPTFPAKHANHLFYFITNLDTGDGPPYASPWIGPSSTFCTAYVNIQDNKLHVEFQANKSGVGWFTPPGGHAGHVNDQQWHNIRAYFKLNTYTGTTPNADGIFRIWLDGVLVCENTAVKMVHEQSVNPYFTQVLLAPHWSTSYGDAPATLSSFLVDALSLNIPGSGIDSGAGEGEVVSGASGRDDPFFDPPAGMAVLYVDGSTGDDTTGDGSSAKPWKTLQFAVPRLQPGQELRVRPTADYIINDSTSGYTMPSLHTSTSGTAQKPIIMRGDPAYNTKPRLRRTIGGISAPIIGGYHREHIWIMDMEIDGADNTGRAVRFGFCRDCRIIRCDIHHTKIASYDNCSPLGMEACTRCYVYGNDIHDSVNDGSNTNASGIIMYESYACVFSFNDFYNLATGAGIKDKSDGQDNPDMPAGSSSHSNIIEHNRFRATCRNGVEMHVQNNKDITGVKIRYNLFKSGTAINGSYHNEPGNLDGVYDLEVHHNTFFGFNSLGVRPGAFGDNWRFHSNIFYTSRTSTTGHHDIRTGAPATTLDELGWNVFRYSARVMVDDVGGGSVGSLISVDATNVQNHAPAWSDTATDDFRLLSSSPLLTAGKGGTAIGAFGEAGKASWGWWLPQTYTPPAGLIWEEDWAGWTGTDESLYSGIKWPELEDTNNNLDRGGITSATRASTANKIYLTEPALFGENAFEARLKPPSREPGYTYGQIGSTINTDTGKAYYCRFYIHAMPGYKWNQHNSKLFYFTTGGANWWNFAWRMALWVRPAGYGSTSDRWGTGFASAPKNQSWGRPFIHFYHNQSGFPGSNWETAASSMRVGTYNGGEYLYFPNVLNGVRQSRHLSYEECVSQDFFLDDGRTRMIEMYFKPAPANSRDGAEVRVWIDNKLAIEFVDNPAAVYDPNDIHSAWQRIIPRPVDNNAALSHIWLSNYYGGSGDEPPQEQWLIYDGLAVGTGRIGSHRNKPAY